MTSLRELGPVTGTVKIGGKEVTTYGITLPEFLNLCNQFEEIRLLMEGRMSELSPERIMKMGGAPLSHIIAEGTTDPAMDVEERKKAIEATAKVARAQSISAQTALVRSIFDNTFEGGVGPFVENLNAIMQGLYVKPATTAEGQSEASSKSSETPTLYAVVTHPSQIPAGLEAARRVS
jgi:hypothetical protein